MINNYFCIVYSKKTFVKIINKIRLDRLKIIKEVKLKIYYFVKFCGPIPLILSLELDLIHCLAGGLIYFIIFLMHS